MANGPNDFRDPKVTSGSTTGGGGGIGKWIGIGLAILVVVLLLAWLLGLFADDDVDATLVPTESGTTTVIPSDDNAATVGN